MELVNELYAFSEGTAHGAPTRGEPPVGRGRAAADDRRAARGDRRAGRDDLAVRAAHGRGAVADARPRRRARDGARGRRSIPRSRRRHEVVVPVQVNGKVRARLTVPADASDDELRELALADPAVTRLHRRQDDPEGRRRARDRWSAWWFHDRVTRRTRWTRTSKLRSGSASVSFVSFVSFVLRTRLRLLPRRPRLVPARPTSGRIGVPTFANRTTVFNLETHADAEGARPSSSAAASIRSCRRRPASTRC